MTLFGVKGYEIEQNWEKLRGGWRTHAQPNFIYKDFCRRGMMMMMCPANIPGIFKHSAVYVIWDKIKYFWEMVSMVHVIVWSDEQYHGLLLLLVLGLTIMRWRWYRSCQHIVLTLFSGVIKNEINSDDEAVVGGCVVNNNDDVDENVHTCDQDV